MIPEIICSCSSHILRAFPVVSTTNRSGIEVFRMDGQVSTGSLAVPLPLLAYVDSVSYPVI